MKILVTGGAGFIGSNLCYYLLENNCKVVVVDDLSTGYKENISSILDLIEFHESKLELFDIESLTDIDAVVHLAAQPSVPISITNFHDSSRANIDITIKVVDYCKKKSIPLIYASSSAIYGNLPIGDDEKIAVDLLSPYAVDKYAGELYIQVAYKIFGLSSICLRFFNIFGPRQDPSNPYSGVISVFADRLINGREITINGGYQTRDFIYVRDVVNIIYRAIQLAKKENVCEFINVLSGRSVSIDMLADKLIKITKSYSQKKYKELLEGDPLSSVGTTSKLKRVLQIDTNQLLSFDNGLVDTLNFIKDSQINNEE